MSPRFNRPGRVRMARRWARAGLAGVLLSCGGDHAINPVAAATITWTGTAGGPNWAAPMNWDLNRPPFNGDDVFFGPSPQTATVDNLTSRTVSSITFDPAVAAMYSVTVTGNATLCA